MPKHRQTLTVEYPDHYGPFMAGGTFHSAKVLSATQPEILPDRALLTIKIEIDRPYGHFSLVDHISESILEFLADDAEEQREPLVAASMHPVVESVDLTIVT